MNYKNFKKLILILLVVIIIASIIKIFENLITQILLVLSIVIIVILTKILIKKEKELLKKDVLESEKHIKDKLDKNNNLAIQEWCRKNDLLYLKDNNTDDENFTNILFFSKDDCPELPNNDANSLAYLFLTEYSPFKKYHCFDLSLHKRDKRLQILMDILKKCKIYDRSKTVIEYFALKLGVHSNDEDNGTEESLLSKISNRCNDYHIGLFFMSIDKTPPDLIDIVHDCLKEIKRIVCSGTDNENISNFEDENLFQRFILPPLDYYSHLVRMHNFDKDVIYLGDVYSPLSFNQLDFSDSKNIAHKILPKANDKLYIDSYVICGGKYCYIQELKDYLKEDPDRSAMPLLYQTKFYDRIYEIYYKEIFKSLDDKEKELLGYLSLIPFSVHNDDFNAFCKEIGIKSLKETKKKLLNNELIYETKPYQYFNYLNEWVEIRDEYKYNIPDIISIYKYFFDEECEFILDKTEEIKSKYNIKKVNKSEVDFITSEVIKELKKIDKKSLKNKTIERITEDVLEQLINNKYIYSYLCNGLGSKKLNDLLIRYSLIHRFLFNDHSIYISDLVRNIIIKCYDSLNINKIKKYLYSFYYKKVGGNNNPVIDMKVLHSCFIVNTLAILYGDLNFLNSDIYHNYYTSFFGLGKNIKDIHKEIKFKYFSHFSNKVMGVETYLEHYRNLVTIFTHLTDINYTYKMTVQFVPK